MGDNNLPTRSDGQTILDTFFNVFKTAFIGHLVPRNASGDPESVAGNIGTTTYPFKQAHIDVGHLYPGMIMPYLDYGRSLQLKGWMLCDGREINETNYNAEWGAGSWAADGIAANTPFASTVNLPDLVDRLIFGSDSFPSGGLDEGVATGGSLAGSYIHNHKWAHDTGSAQNTYDSGGVLKALPLEGSGSEGAIGRHTDVDRDDFYTSNSAGTVTIPEQPHIKTKFFMRVVY